MSTREAISNLKKIFYLLAKGICQKYHKFERSLSNREKGYPYSPLLHHALNELLAFAIIYRCVDEHGHLLAPRDETDALVNYFAHPVQHWMSAWPDNIKQGAQAEYLYDLEEFVELGAGHEFYPTKLCQQMAEVYRHPGLELEQEEFYNALKQLRQEEYVEVRRFVITNRVVKSEKLDAFIQSMAAGGNKEIWSSLPLLAYEKVENARGLAGGPIKVCGRCGWTVAFDQQGRGDCQDPLCRIETNNFTDIQELPGKASDYRRLKKGIMQFVADPGTIELELEKECLALGLPVELWPKRDSYDLALTFPDGERWAVDAKDYAHPFLLKEKIERSGEVIPPDDWSQGFIVVPDHRALFHQQYTCIVQKGIQNVPQRNDVKCLTKTEFIRRVREKAKGVAK